MLSTRNLDAILTNIEEAVGVEDVEQGVEERIGDSITKINLSSKSDGRKHTVLSVYYSGDRDEVDHLYLYGGFGDYKSNKMTNNSLLALVFEPKSEIWRRVDGHPLDFMDVPRLEERPQSVSIDDKFASVLRDLANKSEKKDIIKAVSNLNSLHDPSIPRSESGYSQSAEAYWWQVLGLETHKHGNKPHDAIHTGDKADADVSTALPAKDDPSANILSVIPVNFNILDYTFLKVQKFPFSSAQKIMRTIISESGHPLDYKINSSDFTNFSVDLLINGSAVGSVTLSIDPDSGISSIKYKGPHTLINPDDKTHAELAIEWNPELGTYSRVDANRILFAGILPSMAKVPAAERNILQISPEEDVPHAMGRIVHKELLPAAHDISDMIKKEFGLKYSMLTEQEVAKDKIIIIQYMNNLGKELTTIGVLGVSFDEDDKVKYVAYGGQNGRQGVAKKAMFRAYISEQGHFVRNDGHKTPFLGTAPLKRLTTFSSDPSLEAIIGIFKPRSSRKAVLQELENLNKHNADETYTPSMNATARSKLWTSFGLYTFRKRRDVNPTTLQVQDNDSGRSSEFREKKFLPGIRKDYIDRVLDTIAKQVGAVVLSEVYHPIGEDAGMVSLISQAKKRLHTYGTVSFSFKDDAISSLAYYGMHNEINTKKTRVYFVAEFDSGKGKRIDGHNFPFFDLQPNAKRPSNIRMSAAWENLIKHVYSEPEKDMISTILSFNGYKATGIFPETDYSHWSLRDIWKSIGLDSIKPKLNKKIFGDSGLEHLLAKNNLPSFMFDSAKRIMEETGLSASRIEYMAIDGYTHLITFREGKNRNPKGRLIISYTEGTPNSLCYYGHHPELRDLKTHIKFYYLWASTDGKTSKRLDGNPSLFNGLPQLDARSPSLTIVPALEAMFTLLTEEFGSDYMGVARSYNDAYSGSKIPQLNVSKAQRQRIYYSLGLKSLPTGLRGKKYVAEHSDPLVNTGTILDQVDTTGAEQDNEILPAVEDVIIIPKRNIMPPSENPLFTVHADVPSKVSKIFMPNVLNEYSQIKGMRISSMNPKQVFACIASQYGDYKSLFYTQEPFPGSPMLHDANIWLLYRDLEPDGEDADMLSVSTVNRTSIDSIAFFSSKELKYFSLGVTRGNVRFDRNEGEFMGVELPNIKRTDIHLTKALAYVLNRQGDKLRQAFCYFAEEFNNMGSATGLNNNEISFLNMFGYNLAPKEK